MKRADTVRRCRILFIVGCVAFAAGCAGKGEVNHDQQTASGQTTTPEQQEALGEQTADEQQGASGEQTATDQQGETQAPEPSLEEKFYECCEKETWGNVSVPADFYGWLEENYGEEVIAKAVEEQNAEPDTWYDLTGNTLQVLLCEFEKEKNPEAVSNVYWKECASDTEIVMDFTGDISLAETARTTQRLDNYGGDIAACLSEELLQELKEADILMINNEFTYSTRGTPLAGKSYTFRANPSRVAILDEIGADIVGLANNHVYDYGEEALLDTLTTLEEEGMPYVGAGRNLEEAKKPVYFIANGRKIAIVAATQIERSTLYTREATETSAGVLRTLDPEKFVGVIEEAEKNSDLVIAYVHWGTEGSSYYQADQMELAKAYVEAGADIIIGGHTHCLQGISFIGEVPVFYSLGNFWFNGKTMNTGIAQIILKEDGSIEERFLPCVQADSATRLVTDESEKQTHLTQLQSISDGIKIDGDGWITTE